MLFDIQTKQENIKFKSISTLTLNNLVNGNIKEKFFKFCLSTKKEMQIFSSRVREWAPELGSHRSDRRFVCVSVEPLRH